MRALSLLLLFAIEAQAASRYWVGGGASTNWNATGNTNWSATDGGANNASVPGSTDDVFFTATSGAVTTVISANITIQSLDCTGFTGTLTHSSATLTIAGNGVIFKLVAGMTFNPSTGTVSFTGTSGTNLLTFSGKTIYSIIQNGAGGTTQFQDAASVNYTFLTSGTLDTNSQAFAIVQVLSSNSNLRTLTLGSSAITAGSNSAVFSCTTSTNLTVTANTATVTISGGSTPAFDGGSANWNGLTLSFTGYQVTLYGSGTYGAITKSVTFGGDYIKFTASPTVTGTLTLNGNNAGANRLLVTSDTLGTARTLTAATVTVTNADFRDITGAGAGSWNLASITGGSGDCGGNSGITFTTAQDNYWVSGTGSWSNSAKWKLSDHATAGRVPLPQDGVKFDASSFTGASQTVTLDMPRAGKTIDWTGATNTPAWAKTSTASFYGSVTMIAAMTNSGTATISFENRDSQTFTSTGQTWTNPLSLTMIGGTLTLQDAFSSSSTVTHSNGTLNANGFNVTCTTFTSNSGSTRTLTMGSGAWTVNSTGSIWTLTTSSLTLNANTSTITVSNTSSTAKTFAGGGATYNNITFSGDNLTVTGANTFATMAVNNAALTNGLILPASTTQTVTGFSTNGSAGNLAILKSSSAGTAATLSKSSGSVAVDYMSIKDSAATGGATWCAGANSTSVSGNSGWTFSSCGGGTVTKTLPLLGIGMY